MTRKLLLFCGVLSSVVYLLVDVAALLKYPGYDFSGQVISELSAIGAASRPAVAAIGILYTVLLIAFGAGILLSAGEKRGLRAAGILLIASAVFGAFWPPMHMRGAQPTLTDTLHIVWTAGWLLFTLAFMLFAGAALGKRFFYYTIATIAVVLTFGTLTGMQGVQLAHNLPTPFIGIEERIDIGAYLLWMAVLSITMLRQSSFHFRAERTPVTIYG